MYTTINKYLTRNIVVALIVLGGLIATIQQASAASWFGGIRPGGYLFRGESVVSWDRRSVFVYQTDGNLVLYHQGVPLWASGTTGYLYEHTWIVYMQYDGNLVMYGGAWDWMPLWSTGTFGNPGAYLLMQDDANVVIYRPDGRAIWSTGTCCR